MKILIAAPCRQDEETFKLYLEALDALEIPKGVKVDRLFMIHNSPYLIPLVRNYFYAEVTTNDALKNSEETHNWDIEKVKTVASMKNYIACFALHQGYDYVFFVDTDLILHPRTLIALLNAQKDIVAECFWTRWTPEDIEAPNAWDADQYFIFKENFEKWKVPGLYKVGMSGACILISKKVLEAGVRWIDIPNLTLWGEDRWFGVRAACAGFETWLDTHYPPIHLYRPSELEKYKRGCKTDETEPRQKMIERNE